MPQTESPFRYPGGKTQLFKFVTKLLDLNNTHQMYIEPFAGGAGIPLKLLIQNKVSTVWINDYDAAIFSVWNAILNNPNELIEKIRTVPF
ncbi:DNA adenine methylase, partial [Lactiplantibacillus plantarum]